MRTKLLFGIFLMTVCIIQFSYADGQFTTVQNATDGDDMMNDYIQVRLSVQPEICATTNPPYNSTYFQSNVRSSSTLFEVMEQAEPLGFTFNYTTFPKLGVYITTVNGLFANDTLHQYWGLYDGWTGKLLPLGASSYVTKNGDNIVFQLSLFQT